MTNTKDLNKIFETLNEMTSAKHIESTFSPSKKLQKLENLLITLTAGSLILVVIATFLSSRFSHALFRPEIVLFLYIAYIALSILYVITMIFSLVQTFINQRKNPYSIIMQRFKLELDGDSKFLSKLESFDKSSLSFALIKYRQSWNILENRTSLLVGNLKKVGIFPVLAAASISASTLIKQDSNLYLWTPITLAIAFYIIGFIALAKRERAEHIIEILEYLINKK